MARAPMFVVRCRVPDGDDGDRTTDLIGGIDVRGAEWHLPVRDAARLVRQGRAVFALRAPARRQTHRVTTGPLVPLEVATSARGRPYLRADGGHGARLADLPHCTHRIHTPPVLDSPLDEGCRKAIEYLREHCPDLIPTRVEPGDQTAPIPVDTQRVGTLVQLAAVQAGARAAGLSRYEADDPPAVLWRDGIDALLVLLDTVSVHTADGLVTVAVEVACDQLGRRGRARVFVDLVVGTPDRPTGMLVAAPRPRGPLVVVDRWGDALIAFAWQAMINTAAGLGAALGHDEDDAPLLPNQWAATPAGLQLGAQARHPFDAVGVGGAATLATRRGAVR